MNKEKLEKLEELKEWQKIVLQKLREQNNRKVLFVVDPVGGAGKSALGKHIVAHGNAWMTRGGKFADLTHAWCKEEEHEYVIFDMAKCTKFEFWPYSFIEQLKDGMVFTPKYDSSQIVTSRKKIVVFCNEVPDRTKLSKDRYDVMFISRE